MRDHLDVPLEDAELMEEVELVSALIIAASEADDHLDEAQIDKVLGLRSTEFPRQSAGHPH